MGIPKIAVEDKYNLIGPEPFAKGYYGDVWKAEPKSCGSFTSLKAVAVAVKKIAAKKFANDLQAQREIENENKCLTDLCGQRGIVKLIDSFENDEGVVFVTELCKGTLDTLWKKCYQTFKAEVKEKVKAKMAYLHKGVDLFLNAACCVFVCQKNDIVHRDIKM